MLHHRRQAHPSGAPRQLPDSGLEASQSFGRNPPPRLFLVRQAKAQKLARRRPRHRALGCVDLELETVGDEVGKTGLHPPPRALAADVHIAIVRIAHEAVSTPLQLLVHFVEHQVAPMSRPDYSPLPLPCSAQDRSGLHRLPGYHALC